VEKITAKGGRPRAPTSKKKPKGRDTGQPHHPHGTYGKTQKLFSELTGKYKGEEHKGVFNSGKGTGGKKRKKRQEKKQHQKGERNVQRIKGFESASWARKKGEIRTKSGTKKE